MSSTMIPVPPGMKIAAQASPEPKPEDLQFIQQMGVEYVVLWTGGDKASYEYYASRKALYEAAGLKTLPTTHGVPAARRAIFIHFRRSTQSRGVA